MAATYLYATLDPANLDRAAIISGLPAYFAHCISAKYFMAPFKKLTKKVSKTMTVPVVPVR